MGFRAECHKAAALVLIQYPQEPAASSEGWAEQGEADGC